MFKRKATIIPVQVIVSQNPFAARSTDALAVAIEELKEISANLRVVALQQLGSMQDQSTRKQLIAAYRIKTVLRNCQNCHDLMSETIVKRANDKPAARSSTQYEKLAKTRTETAKNTDFSIQIINDAIDQYKTLHTKPFAPIITRIAGASTVTVASWGMANVIFTHDNFTPRIIVSGVAMTAFPLSFHESVAAAFRNVKAIFKRRTKETPYYVVAEQKIAQIILGNKACGSKESKRPAQKKGKGSNKARKLAR